MKNAYYYSLFISLLILIFAACLGGFWGGLLFGACLVITIVFWVGKKQVSGIAKKYNKNLLDKTLYQNDTSTLD